MRLLKTLLVLCVLLGFYSTSAYGRTINDTNPIQSSVNKLTVQEQLSFDQNLLVEEINKKADPTVVIIDTKEIRLIKETKRTTLNQIANKNDLDLTHYKNENGADPNPKRIIRPGQTVMLFEVEQQVDLHQTKLPIPTEYIPAEGLPKGVEVPISLGKEGLAITTTIETIDSSGIKALNSEATKKSILNTEEVTTVITPPVANKILLGTSDTTTISETPDGVLFTQPIPGEVVSPFGMRVHPITGIFKLHDGIDFNGYCGEGIEVVASGEVTSAKYEGGYGNRVIVDHGGDLVTSYSHLNSIDVKVGDKVDARKIIGEVGNTGYSTGCHLHFMVEYQGNHINPATVFGLHSENEDAVE